MVAVRLLDDFWSFANGCRSAYLASNGYFWNVTGTSELMRRKPIQNRLFGDE
jgi:hypothetical protein